MSLPLFAHADAIVREIHPAAHLVRAVGRRVVRVAGSQAVKTYDQRFYPQRIDRDIAHALPIMRAPLQAHTQRAVPRVVQVIGSLGPGGAERQLAVGTAASHSSALVAHTVVTSHRTIGAAGHYRAVLENAGVEIRAAGEFIGARAAARLRGSRALRRQLFAIPADLGPEPLEIAGEILDLEPDIIHAWLDHTNIFAGVACLATGAPRVVLSLRSLAPTHFPALLCDWMLPWYRVLADEPRVTFVANSNMGADDYARWIGMPRSRIEVIHNGLDPSQFALEHEEDASRMRDQLGARGRPLVLGVFRVGDEKNPHHFIHVARRVLARLPDCVFAIAGEGPMLADMRRFTEDLGDSVRTLGRRDDVPALIAASDAMLLCSRVEGLPNVLIEAQALGCPVIATDAGGTRETMVPNETGFLRPVADVHGLADDLLRVLTDAPLREQLSRRARSFARERFSLESMVQRMHGVYGIAHGGL